MKFQLVITRRADRDVRSAIRQFENVAPSTIRAWAERLERKFVSLLHSPRRNALWDANEGAVREIRVDVFGKRSGAWTIYYEIAGDEVRILHVRRASREDPTADDLA